MDADRLPRWRPLLLVGLLLASLMVTLPTASAASGDLAMTNSLSPTEGQYINAYTPVTLQVQVTNEDIGGSSDPRDVEWEACPEGAPTGSTHCRDGAGTIPSVATLQSLTYTFPTQWSPPTSHWPAGTVQGNYTVTFTFTEGDFDTSDDTLVISVIVTEEFKDIIVPADQDPRDGLLDVASDGDGAVLNTNVTYPRAGETWRIDYDVYLCGGCDLNMSWGWRLMHDFGGAPVAESITDVDLTGYNWGGLSQLSRNLPAFSYDEPGRYLLEFGVFNSSGDLVTANNVGSVYLRLDDTSDLVVMGFMPTHNTQDPNAPYYYGNDAIVAMVENHGNTTISGLSMTMTITDLLGNLDTQQSCELPSLVPGADHSCLFDLDFTGLDRRISVTIPVDLGLWNDVNPEDNEVTQNGVDIEVGPIGASISQSNSNGIYTTDETMTLVARTSDTAAGPLNYTWKIDGPFDLVPGASHGQVVEVPVDSLDLGDHRIKLIVRDVLGFTQSRFLDITVLHHTAIDGGLAYTGQGVSLDEAVLAHEVSLPQLGLNYGVGNGKAPLMLHSFGLESPDGTVQDVGLLEMSIQFNLSELLPDNIDPETVELRMLPAMNSTAWDFVSPPNEATVHDDGTIDVILRENAVLMFIGVLPAPQIVVENVTIERRPNGHLELHWDAGGDLENPYLSGWNIYRLAMPTGSSTFFPSPEASSSTSFWEDFTATTLVASTSIANDRWYDDQALATGTCASYLIAPADRAGVPDLTQLNVSSAESGLPGLFCADAIPPELTVTNMRATSTFSNDTACHARTGNWDRCYDVAVTWTWPDHEPEGNVSWDLYRVEINPTGLDLGALTPVVENMQAVPGEQGRYEVNGTLDESIRPYRLFYYVLTPTDAVGNDNPVAISGNSVGLLIEDQWWEYNQHLIPEPEPEPEPPLGSPWVGKLLDGMASDSLFQSALGVLLLAFVTVAIGLPVLRGRHRRLKRIVAARIRQQQANTVAEEFDDFF